MQSRLEKLVRKHKLLSFALNPAILLRRRYIQRFSSAYDSLFKMVEGGSAIVRIPEFQGLFEIDIRSHILKSVLMDKQFEPDLAEVARRYADPQKDVLDIGANIGLYTILFSKIISKSNKVLSVEPTPLALEYLHRNIQRNGCSHSVIVFDGIAADAMGDFQINVIPGLEEYSSVGKIVHSSVQQKTSELFRVKGDTIDNLVNTYNLKPGFIKIDVEGAEYLVLNGAMMTIRKYQPVILSELSDRLLSSCGATSEMVKNILQENGYRIIPTSDGVLALPKGFSNPYQ